MSSQIKPISYVQNDTLEAAISSSQAMLARIQQIRQNFQNILTSVYTNGFLTVDIQNETICKHVNEARQIVSAIYANYQQYISSVALSSYFNQADVINHRIEQYYVSWSSSIMMYKAWYAKTFPNTPAPAPEPVVISLTAKRMIDEAPVQLVTTQLNVTNEQSSFVLMQPEIPLSSVFKIQVDDEIFESDELPDYIIVEFGEEAVSINFSSILASTNIWIYFG